LAWRISRKCWRATSAVAGRCFGAAAFFGATDTRFAAAFGGVAGFATAGFATAADAWRTGFAAGLLADFLAGAAELADLRGALFFTARVAGRFAAAFFADFLAGVFLAILRAAFAPAFFATFFAALFATFAVAVLRRAAGRLAFAAFRTGFGLRVVGLIIVSGSSARGRAGAISVTRRGFTRANPIRIDCLCTISVHRMCGVIQPPGRFDERDFIAR
jgi:hypothetical protein